MLATEYNSILKRKYILTKFYLFQKFEWSINKFQINLKIYHYQIPP